MNKDSNNEQIDENVKSSKPNVLRAKDIVPPFGKEPHRKRESSEKSKTSGSLSKQQILAQEKEEILSSGKKQESNEIPRFDLAEEIMAEQRKVTAIKRKPPGKKTETQSKEDELESTGYVVKQLPETLSEQEQIIAEIVARDIQQFCRRTTPV